ncbi:uncharacterized protein [Amphiura filiformis]|uniref:uncharacterized protein n=1 Tax=Amphiura filiformis TaxID=82378 RepID=UPI003B20EDA2
MVKDLVLKPVDLVKGTTVLVSWKVVTGFVEVIPAQVVEVVDTSYLWVKPDDSHSTGCVRVHIDNICKTTHDNQILNQDVDSITVSHEDVNIIRLMLSATQSELNAITSTYHNVLAELKQESNNNSDLKCQMSELQQLYDDSLNTVKEYKQQLLDSVNTSQEQSTLQDIILRHTKDLEEKQTEILRLDATIQILREENKRQEEEIRNLHQDNCRLQEILKERNIKYEQRPAGGDNVVRVRKIGTTSKRPESFYPLSIPNANSSSSTAGRMTLKRRAEQLNQVLHIISARKDPSQADIVQTLAQFLRQYPDIALPACKTARISFQTDISPKDAVDLKVLLRLPMSRMRDLRRYLSRLKIRLLPSDRHLYKEMSGRQYMGEESVEVGIINLQKTGQSLADTPVAYFRVKCLKDYIASHIEKQLDMNNTWHDDNFNQELWLKIGGDKGGTTTKMAFQLVNQNAPNSSASTNIISMFEATDTYINLKEVFSNLSEQISELMKVKQLELVGRCTRYWCSTLGTPNFYAKCLDTWVLLQATLAYGAMFS